MADIGQIISNIGELLQYNPKAPLIFSSGLFWALFMLFLPVFALLRRRYWQMVTFVVVFSLLFYYKSSGWFVLMLTATSLIDWLMSRQMTKSDSRIVRRICLAASLSFSLGILVYYKYANMYMWNWDSMVRGNFSPGEIILPVGISFYTFQSVSYMVDVYKRKVQPAGTWLEYAFYLTFFPALVAGPIVRADYFLPQLKSSTHAGREQMYAGLWLIILGVLKKALIADYIAQYNDLIYSAPGAYSGFETLMGVVGYTMQIYCDFSGYSDMAIGIAMIMGFKLMMNFNFPYKSRNLTDFWHRWHISLSTWLRDYIYIPLGGNRKGTLRTYINNMLTMLIGGLWHGAGWKFIFWGGMHGLGLAIHKACRPYLAKVPDTGIVKAVSLAVTLTTVSLLWVFFRADSFTDAWVIIRTIFTDFSLSYVWPFVSVRYVWVMLMAAIIVAHSLPTRWWDRVGEWFVGSPWIAKLLVLIVVVQLVVEFQGEDVAPFIYFQF